MIVEIGLGRADGAFDLGAVADDTGNAISRSTFSACSARVTFPGWKYVKGGAGGCRAYARIVIHDRPAWKPSRISFSNRARSSHSGTPHSSS